MGGAFGMMAPTATDPRRTAFRMDVAAAAASPASGALASSVGGGALGIMAAQAVEPRRTALRMDFVVSGAARAGRPFFLYVGFAHVHVPQAPRPCALLVGVRS